MANEVMAQNVLLDNNLYVEGEIPARLRATGQTVLGTVMGIGSVLIRKTKLNMNDLHTDLLICEDWLMWCRLAAKGPFIFI